MSDTTDHQEFIDFVSETEFELRYQARLAAGDPDNTARLIRRTLAVVAQNWRIAAATDPHRYLFDALANQANSLWRDELEARPDEQPETTVTTALALADQAWDAGRRLRRRRRRRTAITATIAAVILGSYLLSVNQAPAEPPPQPHTSERVTGVDDRVSVLPPPDLTLRADAADPRLPDAYNVRNWAPSLARSPVETIMAAYQLPGNRPHVVDSNGEPRIVDAATEADLERTVLRPRGISPDGTRLALLPPDSIAIVDTEGSVSELEVPDIATKLLDIAWFPDGERLLVTAEGGSYAVDAESGAVTTNESYGPATTFDAETGDAVEFVSTGNGPLALQHWQRDRPGSRTALPDPETLPIVEWQGAPFAGSSDFVRGCVPETTMDIPVGYGTPHGCIAVVEADATVSAILLIADGYPYEADFEVLGADSGHVFFTVDDLRTQEKLLLVWSPAGGKLQRLFTVDVTAELAFRP